jgi:hypothetical protein
MRKTVPVKPEEPAFVLSLMALAAAADGVFGPGAKRISCSSAS